MAECKKCGEPIIWKKKPDGNGFYPPQNPDGTRHNCENDGAQAKTDPGLIIGRLDAYTTGSATFTVKDGSQKTYAITVSIQREWQAAGFLNGTSEVWLSFSLDKNHFVQAPKQVPKPEWASGLSNKTIQKAMGPGGGESHTQFEPEHTAPPTETRTSPERSAVPATAKDVWSAECEEFKQLLISTKRDGIQDLLKYLEEETDFFIAPSSTKYHDARDGGLLHHSLSTYHNLVTLSRTFAGDYPEDSLRIIGLLHDICKANFYKTSFRNVKHEERPIGDQWIKEPYIDIDDQFPLGHGEKSAILLLRHIFLTDIEIMAIRWHMMAYDDIRCSYAGNLAITNACTKFPVIVLMHIADLSASFLEMRSSTGGES
jgi:hypothetical protein